MKVFTKNSLNRKSAFKKAMKNLGSYISYLHKILKNCDTQRPESFLIIEHKAKEIGALIKKYNLLETDLVVFCAMGGSVLGVESFYFALDHKLKPALFFDSLDPNKIKNQLSFLRRQVRAKKKVTVIYISKSASTFETNFNFSQVRKVAGSKAKYVFISDDAANVIEKLGLKEVKGNVLFLEMNKAIGGRFSQFDWTIPFSLGVLGADSNKIIQGAEKSVEVLGVNHPAAAGAAEIYLAGGQGRHNLVSIFNDENLFFLGRFLDQLLAESLGKNGKGIFPKFIFATSDFHSILQDLVAGRNNKFINIISTNGANDIYRQKQSVLINSVKKMFVLKHKPFIETELGKASEENLGYFMMTKMIEVLFLGKLLKINPFGQPDIELYKQIARKKF